MALTTGINQVYSSAYRPLPQKALPLGTPSSVYEPINQTVLEAGTPFLTYFQYTIPVGFGWASATNYDVLNLCSVGGNYPNTAGNTVVPGFRIKRVAIRSSANAGGTVPILIGFATANNLFNVNANTSAYLGGAVITGNGTVAVAGTISGTTGSTFIQSANQALADVVPTGNLFNNTDTLPILTAADTLILCATAAAIQTTTACTVSGYVEYYLTGPTGF